MARLGGLGTSQNFGLWIMKYQSKAGTILLSIGIFRNNALMKQELNRRGNGLEIKLTEMEGKEAQLLEAFEDCQYGCCSWPMEITRS